MNSWMKNIPNDTFISNINIPGTHNTCSLFCDFSFASRCQSHTLTEQLNMGVRFIDIRAEKKGDGLYVVHSISKCYSPQKRRVRLSVKDGVDECFDFLENHPTETIIFSFKRDAGDSPENTLKLFFETCIKGKENFWYTENKTPEISRVRGKIVLLNRCAKTIDNTGFSGISCGLDFTGWPYMERVENSHKLPMNFDTEKAYIQDFYKMNPKEKWTLAIKPFLLENLEENSVIINMFSGTTPLNLPKKYAKTVLKKFIKFPLEKQKKYGWIILDYPTENVIKNIVESNF